MSKKTHHFQAEVSELLHLVTHSLYSNPEIFLRELISNASDAADKLRFEALNQAELLEKDPHLEIRIDTDKDKKTLTISDNGIGMSEAEVIENLGTIAKSGTKAFLNNLKAEEKNTSQLVGQFGVGFYSGFIVADRITVETRRAGLSAKKGVRWSSDGSGDFEIEPINEPKRGTRIVLHLREDHLEFLELGRLKQIITKYSDHIGLPILLPKETWNKDKGEMERSSEWETVNQANALWTLPKKDITPEQYQTFYEHLNHDTQAPLAYTHNRVEGSTEYIQLLYIPSKAPFDLYQRDVQHGLKLYVRRVFIMDKTEVLLPNYLRFVKGIVDSADLPLNVSRELLQQSKEVKAIRSGNTHRVLSLLEELANHSDAAEQDKYAAFYAEFGSVIKEGLAEDFGNRERIAKLLRFVSTKDSNKAEGLSAYKERMKEGQEAIYYLIAENLSAAQSSPQLEIFKKKGIEVLLLTDRVDEWAMSYIHEFDGIPMQSVAKGAVDLGKLQDEDEKKAAEAAADAAKELIEKIKTSLGDQIKDVRTTARLVDSPACLVVEDGDYSMQLARLLKQAGQQAPDVKPILEINPEHALIKKLESKTGNDADFNELTHILFDQALLAEGSLPSDTAAYVRRVNKLLV